MTKEHPEGLWICDNVGKAAETNVVVGNYSGRKQWLRWGQKKMRRTPSFPKKSGEMREGDLHKRKIPEKKHYGLQPKFHHSSILVLIKC